jgi:hypothetical protein
MDDRLHRIRELIDLKEKTDAELDSLISGGTVEKARKLQTCGKCGAEGHTARTCPQNTQAPIRAK